MKLKLNFTPIIGLLLLCASTPNLHASNDLPSWNQGTSKDAIVAFVERVSKPGSADFVPEPERIATFDNDGTLWAEQPYYIQLQFALDRVKELAPQHPEWADKEPFASVLKGDIKATLAGGEKALMQIVAATHAGISTDEFQQVVQDWIATARHPKTGKLYTEMVYQPMLELLSYLRNNGFKTFIVSGGGVDFMRVFAEKVYGIPPEQVIGSSAKVEYQVKDGKPAMIKQAELNHYDDKAGKPVGIYQYIGRRPIAAFGNSDGDFEMLEWATTGSGVRLGALVHHTDAEREWAYDRTSHIGKLDRGLNEAKQRGWVLVNMKADWNKIFPDSQSTPKQ